MTILEDQSQFSYDEFIEDNVTKEECLRIVREYVDKSIKADGHLTFRGNLSNKERKFTLVEVFDVVSRKDGIYTIHADVDEIGGEPRYILFFDVERVGEGFEFFRVRLGSRHLRQKSMEIKATR